MSEPLNLNLTFMLLGRRYGSKLREGGRPPTKETDERRRDLEYGTIADEDIGL